MKIALVGAGTLPIPPPSWGAVETTIWYRKQHLERLGHIVEVYNTRMIHNVIYAINQRCYDFVHCHCEFFALECNAHLRQPYALTSHFGGLHKFASVEKHDTAFNYLFDDSLHCPANIVLSKRIRDLYHRCGYQGFVRVMRNAVEADQFRFAQHGNGKAICVGRVIRRKRQAELADATQGRVAIDFVGPWNRLEEPAFRENSTSKYLGVWYRSTLYQRLTDYSCLVLLSDSEGAPKVVLEALAAGLSVVITEACAANLASKEFITILPLDKADPDVISEALAAAIANNGVITRQAARAYALQRFDYSVAVEEYVRIIHEFREHFGMAALG